MTPLLPGREYPTRARGRVRIAEVRPDYVIATCRDGERVRYALDGKVYNCDGSPFDIVGPAIEHPDVAKLREQMHSRVARDAEAADVHAEARRRLHRRNEILTRGEILDAIDRTMRVRGGNVGDHHEAVMDMLQALREAFE